MKTDEYLCYVCGLVLEEPCGSDVWCGCRPRVKQKMVNMKETLKMEMKVNRREQE